MEGQTHIKPPLVFDIARGSFVDGPGVRTTVFFKGCPLRCPWCHNPESQSFEEQTLYLPENCIGCNRCRQGKECFALARQTIGRAYTANELKELILADLHYFKVSGGGVTFSGGEALGFIDYLSCILPDLKKHGVHIAVQTCGYFDGERFISLLLPYVDILYFDLKIMDDSVHKRILGKSNRIILNNFKRLLKRDIRIIPRIPLIPGYTATKGNLDALAGFLSNHGVTGCEFMFYNPVPTIKRVQLGMEPIDSSIRLPQESVPLEQNQEWITYFQSRINEVVKN